MKKHFVEVGILLIASILLFGWLGVDELGSADEAIHAQVAREMVRDGHWLYPTYRGEPYFEKPPLKFWLTAITYLSLGESEFTARFWSALFGLGTVWGVMRLGRLFFNRTVGLAAALVLVTTWEFLFNHCARTGELDSAILFFSVMTVMAFWKLRRTMNPSHLYHATFWLALGFLIKGHVALLPILWLPWVWRIEVDQENHLRKRHGLWACALFMGMTAPWFILQTFHYGERYWSYMFHHNLAGYAFGYVEKADASWRYYFEQILWLDYPWPPLVFVGGILLFRRKFTEDLSQLRSVRRGLLAWLGTVFFVFSISKTKLPWYHLPALIPMSLLAGFALERCWKLRDHVKTRFWNRLWLGFHAGLFFLTAGFSSCLWKYFQAWWNHDQKDVSNYTYYFFYDPNQRSALIALATLVGMFLLGIRNMLRNEKRGAHGAFPKIQVILFFGIALGFTYFEILRPKISERARETTDGMMFRMETSEKQIAVHLFDTFHERAPHYGLSPAFYYYLSSSPKASLVHHPIEQRDWERLIQTTQKPCVTIIPSSWIRQDISTNCPLKFLGETRTMKWVSIISDQDK